MAHSKQYFTNLSVGSCWSSSLSSTSIPSFFQTGSHQFSKRRVERRRQRKWGRKSEEDEESLPKKGGGRQGLYWGYLFTNHFVQILQLNYFIHITQNKNVTLNIDYSQ